MFGFSFWSRIKRREIKGRGRIKKLIFYFSYSNCLGSRCVNAFLNTGMGGTVYIGINDEGRVHGVPLTLYRVIY